MRHCQQLCLSTSHTIGMSCTLAEKNVVEFLLIHLCSQGSDVYFQMAEANNSYYAATPDHVKAVLSEIEAVTGRKYGLFDYVGHPQVNVQLCMFTQPLPNLHAAWSGLALQCAQLCKVCTLQSSARLLRLHAGSFHSSHRPSCMPASVLLSTTSPVLLILCLIMHGLAMLRPHPLIQHLPATFPTAGRACGGDDGVRC